MIPEELNARLHCLTLAQQMDSQKPNPGFVRSVKEDAEALLSFAFGAGDDHSIKIESGYNASVNYATEVIPLPFSWERGSTHGLGRNDITMYIGNVSVARIIMEPDDTALVITCFPKQKPESVRIDGPIEYVMKVVCGRLQSWASSNIDDVRAIIATLKEASGGH